VDRASSALVGVLTLVVLAPGVAGIACVIDPRHQGRGFATESVRLLLTLAFERLGMRTVYAQIAAENVASRRVAAKLGAVESEPGVFVWSL
jgi:RimJ/RimL family protein N-acetyltransferase